MDLALLMSAMLLGLAGAPHCAAMCSAPCAAATRGPAAGAGARWAAFLGARLAAYALAGALAASSVGVLAAWSEGSAVLRPLWALVHAAALSLGLWLLWVGRPPAWLEALGRGGRRGAAPTGWSRVHGPLRAGVAGGLWVAWPCGLLHAAWLLAAMASSAAGGALVMVGFAVVTGAALAFGPALWAWTGGGARAGAAAGIAVRLAGVALAGASGFALAEGVWHRVAAYC